MKKRYVIVNDSGYFLTRSKDDLYFNIQFKPRTTLKLMSKDEAELNIRYLFGSNLESAFYSIKEIYLK